MTRSNSGEIVVAALCIDCGDVTLYNNKGRYKLRCNLCGYRWDHLAVRRNIKLNDVLVKYCKDCNKKMVFGIDFKRCTANYCKECRLIYDRNFTKNYHIINKEKIKSKRIEYYKKYSHIIKEKRINKLGTDLTRKNFKMKRNDDGTPNWEEELDDIRKLKIKIYKQFKKPKSLYEKKERIPPRDTFSRY